MKEIGIRGELDPVLRAREKNAKKGVSIVVGKDGTSRTVIAR